jgi:hypothetical protein
MEQKKQTILEAILKGENLGELNYKDLSQSFSYHNDQQNQGIKKYALVDFDWTTWKDLKEQYKNDTQRYWVFDSQNKVFESWAIGYSLFACCLGDKVYERVERLFNNNSIKKAYLITKEQFDKLHE